MAKHGGIKDSGEYFVINPVSRKVTVPHAHKSIATVGDHKSEQITFECPQMVDGHDVTLCDRRYITWINVNGDIGQDELKLTQVENGAEGMIYLAWTIRNPLTVAKGIIQFSVHFEDCSNGTGDICQECGAVLSEDGNIAYRWSTTTCKDCDILDGINGVLGAYKSIYVDGNRLVFSDYTPVRNETVELKTGIVPKGTLTITKEGKHDVGRYAYVSVNTSGEHPAITIENGVVTAEANGLESTMRLEAPVIEVAEDGTITATANGLSTLLQIK